MHSMFWRLTTIGLRFQQCLFGISFTFWRHIIGFVFDSQWDISFHSNFQYCLAEMRFSLAHCSRDPYWIHSSNPIDPKSTKLYVIMLCILNAIYIYFVLYSQITWKKVEFHQIAKSIFCGNGKHAYFILVAGCHFFILISIIFRNISIELFSIVEISKIISFCLVLFFSPSIQRRTNITISSIGSEYERMRQIEDDGSTQKTELMHQNCA